MRYLILFLLSMFFAQTSHSQIYEVGVFAGGSNFIGDVGATNYISPKYSCFRFNIEMESQSKTFLESIL